MPADNVKLYYVPVELTEREYVTLRGALQNDLNRIAEEAQRLHYIGNDDQARIFEEEAEHIMLIQDKIHQARFG